MSYTTVAAGDAILASTINDLIGYGPNRPTGRLIASGTQSIPDAVQTAITFTTEDLDSSNFHSTSSNTSRVTPAKAGWYRVRGTYFTGAAATYVTVDVSIAKNGVSVAPAERRTFSTTATQVSNATSAQCEAMVSVNGTTDYFELMAFQDSDAAKNTNQSSRFSSVLEFEFMVPA